MTKAAEREEWADKQLQMHLKEEQLNASVGEKISLLKKRKRSRWIMLAVNVVAILFFGYSFYFDITQLSNTLIYILSAVFIINVVMIFRQAKQLRQLIQYLQEGNYNSEMPSED